MAKFTAGITLTLALLGGPVLGHAHELPGPLVSSGWLSQHRNEVNIVDVRDDIASFNVAPGFADDHGKKTVTSLGGHVPGARLLDFSKTRTDRMVDGRSIKFLLPERSAFENVMREAGVKAGRATVIVSDGVSGGDLDMAARVYWSMKVYGDDALAILDGGTSGWLAAGLPYSTETSKADRGDWVATAARRQYIADSKAVTDAVSNGTQLVDARPLSFYLGLERKPIVTAAGHIEGAVDFPPEVRATKLEGGEHFLTAAQYAGVFKHLDLQPGKPTITYCNTGHLASGAWFVLSEVLKNPNTRLYDGSMHEWTAESRPVVGLP